VEIAETIRAGRSGSLQSSTVINIPDFLLSRSLPAPTVMTTYRSRIRHRGQLRKLQTKFMPRALSPNLKRLIAHKMSHDAIPNGGGLADGIKFLSSKESIADGWREAVRWVDEAIRIIRAAKEPNPWRDASDEQIAGELLAQIEAKKYSTTQPTA
jgi:hypothetical protein